MTLLQGILTLLAGSIEMQPKRPEFPQRGAPPVTATYCSSLLTYTDRYISKAKQILYCTLPALGDSNERQSWKGNCMRQCVRDALRDALRCVALHCIALHTVLHSLVRGD